MDAVLCVDFDKRRLISGGLDRTGRIWDITNFYTNFMDIRLF